jgi:hypothetical protein
VSWTYIGGGGGWKCSRAFLYLRASWRWVVSFMPLPLYPRERSHRYPKLWSWVDPRAGLNAVEKKKILLFRESRYIFPISKRIRVHSINYYVQSPQKISKILKQNSTGEVLCILKNRIADRLYLNVQAPRIQRLSRSDRKIYSCLQNNEFCLSCHTCSVYLSLDVSVFVNCNCSLC